MKSTGNESANGRSQRTMFDLTSTGSRNGNKRSSHHIVVVGCGHVGLVTAAGFAALGNHVTGVDVQPGLVASLRVADVPFVEPGLEELVAENLNAGRLRFTTSYDEALTNADFVFLCVSTPSTVAGAADLRYLRAACRQLGAILSRTGTRPLIVNKSTSPTGTGETIETILSQCLADTNKPVRIASNPEFLREGSAVHDFFHPSRVVVGSNCPDDGAELAKLYAWSDAPLITTDLRSAEMIKYVSNTYLATRVSFVNEISRLCELLAIDADLVLEGASHDPRIGNAYFSPGIGFGGSCLPKDIAALAHTGESAGMSMRLVRAVQDINISQCKHAVNCIRRAVGTLEGKTIGVWGMAFKGESDDLRDSPALDVIRLLRNEGAFVRAYDPGIQSEMPESLADEVCADPIEAVKGADCLAILTDWKSFRDVELSAVRGAMRGIHVYDGRNVLSRDEVQQHGLVYQGVGRPVLSAVNGGPVQSVVPS